VPAADGRRVRALLQQSAGAAPRSRGEAARAEEVRPGDPAGDRRRRQRGADAGATADDGLSLVRPGRQDPESLGDVDAGRDAGSGRRVDREPARPGARGPWPAVDDAARHARRAHHDPHQPARDSVGRHRRGGGRNHTGHPAAPTSPSARRATGTASRGATTRSPARAAISRRSCARRGSPPPRSGRRWPTPPRPAR